MKRELRIELQLMDPPVAVVTVGGAVDSANAEALDRHIDQAVDQGFDHLVMNFKELDFMSTAGWSVLVGKLRRIRARKGALHLCSLSSDVAEVYRLLEFEPLMPVHATLDEALSAVRAELVR